MKKLLCAFLAAAVALLPARAANVMVNVRDITSGTPVGRPVTVTLVVPQGPVVAGPWVIAGDSVTLRTDTTGSCIFSNMLMIGEYRCDIAGNPGRSFPFSMVAATTNGTYNITQLMGTNSPVEVFYDSAQVDALLNGNRTWVTSSNGTASIFTNVTASGRIFDIYAVTGGGGGGNATNAINNLNGKGTNTTLYGPTIFDTAALTLTNASDSFAGSGAGLINLNGAAVIGTVPSAAVAASLSGVVNIGNLPLQLQLLMTNWGGNLTNLNGSNIVGIIQIVNLPTNWWTEAGIVPATSGHTNQFYLTDGNGLPGWNSYSPGATTWPILGSGVNNSSGFTNDTGAVLTFKNGGIIHASDAVNVNAPGVVGGAAGQLNPNTIGTNALAAGAFVMGTSPSTFKFTYDGSSLTNLTGTSLPALHLQADWNLWNDTNGNYYALSNSLAPLWVSNNFAGLLQRVHDQGGQQEYGQTLAIASCARDGANLYPYWFSNTVNVYHDGCVFIGQGNPSTVFRLANNTNGPCFQLGVLPNTVEDGIARFINIRFEGSSGGSKGVAIQSVLAGEPVYEHCEFNGFKLAGIQMSGTSNSISTWSYADTCWFVIPSGAFGVLVDANVNYLWPELNIRNCDFNQVGSGIAIQVSNYVQNITVKNCRFRADYTGGSLTAPAIQINNGIRYSIVGNDFSWSPSTVPPISFLARGASTNIDSLVANNLADPTNGFLTLGANVNGLNVTGNLTNNQVGYVGEGSGLTNLNAAALFGTMSAGVQNSGNTNWFNNLSVANLSVYSNLNVFGTNLVDYVNLLVTTNGITNLSLTANQLMGSDANKNEISITPGFGLSIASATLNLALQLQQLTTNYLADTLTNSLGQNPTKFPSGLYVTGSGTGTTNADRTVTLNITSGTGVQTNGGTWQNGLGTNINFYGNVNITNGNLVVSNPAPSAVGALVVTNWGPLSAQHAGNTNTTFLVTVQNYSALSNAQGAFQAIADNGNAAVNNVLFGINSSVYTNGTLGNANDAFAYLNSGTNGRNLWIGTLFTNKNVSYATGTVAFVVGTTNNIVFQLSSNAVYEGWSIGFSGLLSTVTNSSGFPALFSASATPNIGSGLWSVQVDANNIVSNTVATARLGSGTANNLSFLRGDQVWSRDGSGLFGIHIDAGNMSNTVPIGNLNGPLQLLSTNFVGSGPTNALGQPIANALQGIIQSGATTNNNVVTLAAGGGIVTNGGSGINNLLTNLTMYGNTTLSNGNLVISNPVASATAALVVTNWSLFSVESDGNTNSGFVSLVRNWNNGGNAQGGFEAEADNGDAARLFLKWGINASGYSNYANVGSTNDAFIMFQGGTNPLNLWIGNVWTNKTAALSTGSVNIVVGTATNIVMAISSNLVTIRTIGTSNILYGDSNNTNAGWNAPGNDWGGSNANGGWTSQGGVITASNFNAGWFGGGFIGNAGLATNLNAGALTGGVAILTFDAGDTRIRPGTTLPSQAFATNTPGTAGNLLQGSGPTFVGWQVGTNGNPGTSGTNNFLVQCTIPFNYGGGSISAGITVAAATNHSSRVTNIWAVSGTTIGSALGTAKVFTNALPVTTSTCLTNWAVSGITLGGGPVPGSTIVVQFQSWDGTGQLTHTNAEWVTRFALSFPTTNASQGSITIP